MKAKEAHARKGPSISMSGASRWMRCPGSVALCATVPKRSTTYSDEGNAAHNLLELCLKSSQLPSEFKGQKDKEFPQHTYTPDMVEAIGTAVDYIWENTDEAHPEEGVDIKECNQPGKDGKGFVDAWWISDRTLYVVDLKYGAGIAVEAKENEQCMGYAGALIRKHFLIMKAARVNKVKIVIIQPRCRGKDPIDEWDTTPKRIVDHMEAIRQAAVLAQTKDAPFKAGEKQCQFCDAKGVCKTFAKSALDVARVSFSDLIAGTTRPADPNTFSRDELGQILHNLDLVRKWCKAIDDHTLNIGLAGNPPTGWKVVESKSQRQWKDDQETIDALLELNLDISLDDVAPRSLLGLGAVGAILKEEAGYEADQLKAFMDEFTKKPQGKPCLAPEDDKRPPFIAAKIEFADLLED